MSFFGIATTQQLNDAIRFLADKLGIAFRDTNNNITIQSAIISSTLNFTTQYLANYIRDISLKQNTYYQSLSALIQQQVGIDLSGLINKIDNAAFALHTNINNSTNRISGELKQTEARLVTSIAFQTDKIGNTLASSFNTVNAKLDNIYAATKIDITSLQNFIASQNIKAIDAIKLNQQSTKDKLYNEIAANQDLLKQKLISETNAAKDKLTAQILSVGSELTKAKAELSQEIKLLDNNENLAKILESIPNPIDVLNVLMSSLAGIPESVLRSYEDFREIIESVQRGKFTDYDTFIKALDSLGGSGQLLNTMFNLGKLLWLSVFGTISAFQPFVNNIITLARTEARDNRLTAEQLLSYFYKTGQNLGFIHSNMAELGYRDDDIQKLITASTALLSPEILRFLYLNGNIQEIDHDRMMGLIGFSERNIFWIKQTYNFTPPVQDLIVMAVREAFSPEIANLFGQYEGYPNILTDYMRRHGVQEQWSKAYWASHWRLPSPEQGFEMFHRGIIDEKTLSLLLRALDIMPFWRDKLINLNYAVLRLVDIRRFYELGVINDEQMYTEYLARGYNPERANWASTWTKLEASKGNEQEQAERRMLTQTVIVKSLNSGRISENQAITMLLELHYTEADARLIIEVYRVQDEIKREDLVIDDNKKRLIKLATDGYSARLINRDESTELLLNSGYTETQASLELDWHDYETENQIKAHIVAWFKELYITWKIDQQQFIISMGEYGFDANEINRLLAEFDILRETRTRTPTFEMVRRWYRSKIIDLEQYVNELRGLGYDEKYIAYFTQEEVT